MSSSELGRLYADGEVIIRQGEPGECMYVVLEGAADVVREHDGGETLLATLGPGDFTGEMALFEREVRSASVRARGEARILTVDRRTLLHRIHEDPSLAMKILERMSHRVRELNAQIGILHAETRSSTGPA
jgi:CRP/FNR family transcriptional regulator, cyclic AMP receptor protein